MPRLSLPVLLLGLLACAHASIPDEKPPSRPPTREGAPDSSRFVLIRAGSNLYSRADVGAELLNEYKAPPTSGVPFTNVFRLVDEHRNWLELESLGDDDDLHCELGLRPLRGLRLKLFAPVESLVPAVARPVSLTWTDGTALSLEPGVPAFPGDGPGRSVAVASRLRFPFSPPDGAVADWYPASTHAPVPKSASLHLSRESLLMGQLRYGDAAVAFVGSLDPTLLVASSVPADFKTALATVQIRCARFTVRVPSPEVRPFKPLLGLLGTESEKGPAPRIGAKVYWRDGTEAGEVIGEFHFDSEEQPAGDRRCFQKALRYRDPKEADLGPSLLHLCLDPADAPPSP